MDDKGGNVESEKAVVVVVVVGGAGGKMEFSATFVVVRIKTGLCAFAGAVIYFH